ncbi:MAG: MetQ/NlpA family ABC transporter substrate-binding protein [Candidatus Dactylopiibacterium sp.]|nr:MetQ/NlpA family ABC transporter substrate-binding protein [Candidatus Dactylopiibacterium sp.]
MKRRFAPVLAGLLAVASFSAVAADKLSVAATPVPHAEILEFIKPELAKQGVELDVKVFTDYVQPNVQVEEKRLDANFFQHQPYLDSFNKEKGSHLVTVALVHVEPFGVYSRKIKNLKDLKDGATVAIPNDPTNGGRALLLLEKAGLIKLKDSKNLQATAKDIVTNSRKLKIRELEAATLPRVIDQVDLAAINTNYALEAGLVPTRDALVIEGAESPYANILVVRQGNENNAAIKKLVAALRTPAVKKFIQDKYKGAVVPAF